MFGSEILEIVIGLFFIYLLLSLICTAINEYIAAVTNKRGKELILGIQQLLRDTKVDARMAAEVRKIRAALDKQTTSDADRRALRERLAALADPDAVFEKLCAHPLIQPLFREKPAWRKLFSRSDKRKPSYIPARTFAMALLDVVGEAGVTPANETATTADLQKIIALLKKETPGDVAEALDPAIVEAAQDRNLAEPVRALLVNAVSDARNELHRLHDSVEVWFNNAMDRVSGRYKRYMQIVSLVIAAGVALLFNVDTVEIWRTLARNDELRTALASQATATREALVALRAGADSVPAQDTSLAARLERGLRTRGTASQDSAADLYRAAMAALDSTDVRFGWTRADGIRLGILQKPTGDQRRRLERRGKAVPEYVVQRNPFGWYGGPFWSKVFGLLVTAFALSLGAPFWFDMLNKVISVRSAGRAPHEATKSPEATGKRAAEQPTK